MIATLKPGGFAYYNDRRRKDVLVMLVERKRPTLNNRRRGDPICWSAVERSASAQEMYPEINLTPIPDDEPVAIEAREGGEFVERDERRTQQDVDDEHADRGLDR